MLVYFVVPDRMKNLVLLLASLFFYGWGEPKYLVFMLASVTQSYIAALLIERFRGTIIAKSALTVSAAAGLGLLAYCKYADFFIGNFNAVTGLSVPLLKVALPVGISFYTFQILSYVIDVYRGDVPAQRNYIDLAMYVAMFPQLIAGSDCPLFRHCRKPEKQENNACRRVGGDHTLFRRTCKEDTSCKFGGTSRVRIQGVRRENRAVLLAVRPRHICCTSISIFPDIPIWR